MESLRQFRDEVEELDRTNLISLSSIKRWFALLGITVAIFSYTWNSIFHGSGFEHFPKAMSPFEGGKSRITFMSEADARKFQLKEINVVITAASKHKTRAYQKEDVEPEVVKDAVVTMKSTVMHTKKVIHFHIFTNDPLYQFFIARLDRWPNEIRHRVSFNFHPTIYPETLVSEYEDDESYRSPLLFVPHILKDIDYIMYIKAGGIFLQSVDQLWANLEDYSSDNVMSLAPYNIYSTCPANRDVLAIDKVFSSSVILLDLYKLRTTVFKVPTKINGNSLPGNVETEKLTWSPNMILKYVNTYSEYFKITQQDILNVMAYYNPKMISQLSHKWNCNAGNIPLGFDEQQTKAIMLKSNLIFSYSGKWSSNLKTLILNADFRNHTLVDWYMHRLL